MRKRLIIVLSVLTLVVALFTYYHFDAPQYDKAILTAFETTKVKQVSVTAYTLNVRAGKGTQFPVIAQLHKGQVVDVIGKLGDWYVIHLSNDMVGAISGRYASPVNNTGSSTVSSTGANLNHEQKKMLELVNSERTKRGLKPLVFDAELARVATIKAQDMVDNNYFSHTSPTYGSPFTMMKNFGIRYTYAGENLAGHNSVENAHTGLMNSDGHRANILNSNFTHIGIGVAKSPRYGYVFVQMFIGK
ncbi:MAG: CAP domain-containing protein [Clostridia bacterium]|jgi:uncharacterized YkwD family protein